ncbi:hypothetical protein [Oceanobacillus oncorhynchi]|uniref:hypothetical protein n=1 Tax=Oceanobacillus oncorhynchi TaxID=545501 RepID=UPI00186899BB|nr:hypothetical protein [Oceanobacillus oncorhynchi]
MIDLVLSQEILERHKAFILGDNKNKDNRLYKKLEKGISDEKNQKVKKILKNIKCNLEKIIIGNIFELEKIKKDFENSISNLSIDVNGVDEKQELFKKLEIFKKEYEYFYTAPNWNAYELQKELGITVCPYCNNQFIFIYESQNGKTRATFDHFFDKRSYPFLAVSIYNLVPACKVCNSDFKGSKNTTLSTHYSPYEEGVSKHLRFTKELYETHTKEIIQVSGEEVSGDIDYVAVILGYKNNFNIKIDLVDTSKELETKINGNLKLFHLEEIYNKFHKQYVQDIILKSHIYNYAYRKQLTQTYNIFFNNPQELKDALLPAIELDKKRILGKLTREIIEDETKHFMI